MKRQISSRVAASVAGGVFALAVHVAGCSPPSSGDGGGTGGRSTGTGGIVGAGGAVGSGGNGSGGAAVGTGGNGSSGNTGETGGSSTGGASTGGVSTGGVLGTGGVGTGGSAGSAGGGSANTGGRAAGGRGGAGGATATGGSSATGGSVGVGGASACPGGKYNAASPPTVLTLSGNLGAHDPAAYVVGNTIYLAATGLVSKTSTNLTSWTSGGNPLALPAWARTATSATNTWAPDISYFGGTYHMYYSASTFGSNRSCIGQATKTALDSGSWADQGMVLCSNMGTTDNWNAIDPNIVIDDAGTPWMAFGSFWSGLKMVKLDSTGARADTMLYSIANGANARGSLEGAWVFKACGYYYLFASWGACCDGAFDYNMRVGRSTTVTGPYVDKAGTSLMSGGGTLLVQGNASWGAPGHNSVIVYNNKVYNLYHALQGGRGTATLRIAEIVWDADGWPVTAGP